MGRRLCSKVGKQLTAVLSSRKQTDSPLAPMYLFSSSGPLTVMQRTLAAATAADTTCVLPHPGGPYSRTPVRKRRGACAGRGAKWVQLMHSRWQQRHATALLGRQDSDRGRRNCECLERGHPKHKAEPFEHMEQHSHVPSPQPPCTWATSLGNLVGSSSDSYSACRTSSMPPTSSQPDTPCARGWDGA